MFGWYLYILQIYNILTCTVNYYRLYKLAHILQKVCNFLIKDYLYITKICKCDVYIYQRSYVRRR